MIGAKFLSIAWEIHRHYPPQEVGSGWQRPPQFVALRQGYGVDTPVLEQLQQAVAQGPELPEIFDLWLIRPEVDGQDPWLTTMPSICRLAAQAPHGNKGGYAYIHYLCRAQSQ